MMTQQIVQKSKNAIISGRFWLIQILVWSAYSLQMALQSFEVQRAASGVVAYEETIIKSMIPGVLAFVITSSFRPLLVRAKNLEVRYFVAIAVIACLIGALVFAVAHFQSKYLLGIYDTSPLYDWRRWISHAPSRLVILGAWTSAYIAIVSFSDSSAHRERAKSLEADAERARIQMLRYQINPHLLFNALNTVSGHVLNKDLAAADQSVQHLSRFLRFSLGDRENAATTLAVELHRIQLYLNVERTRFGEMLEINIDVPPDLLQAQLPPLLLQPLVENAMKHGLSKSSKGGVVCLQARRATADAISIVVRNSIPADGLVAAGGDDCPSFGMGLRNVEERMSLFFAGASRLTIVENDDLSFAVELLFPLLCDGEDLDDSYDT